MNLTKEDKLFLELYSDSEYQKPSVTVDSVIFRLFDEPSNNYRKLPEKKLQVFLTNRTNPPFKNKFSIIGTFIDLGFEVAESAKLCVQKKVGLTQAYNEQLFTFGEKMRDPRNRVISVSYLFLTNQKQNLSNGEWFDVELKKVKTTAEHKHTVTNFELILTNQNHTLINTLELDVDNISTISPKKITLTNTPLAFDHAKMIFYAIFRLRNKLEYTDIIFNMLEEKFTLTELKKSYETILDEKLLDANFRRKTTKLVTPLNEFTSGKGHRTSQLFVKNKNWNKLNLD
jgi:ADP-ribose pyrophosphatase YjhB (NUDIX family)